MHPKFVDVPQWPAISLFGDAMIRVNLYHVFPSDTWAFAYQVPWQANVVGLVAGLKTRENAQRAVDYIGKELDAPVEYLS